MKLKQLVEVLPFNSNSRIFKLSNKRFTEVAVCNLQCFSDKEHKYKGKYANNEVLSMEGLIDNNNGLYTVYYHIFIK